jgi:serine/threonine-protein kinase
VIQNTWKVEEFVARGSMGAVHRAVNTKIGTPVAIKVLNPEFLHDDEIRERFRREATVSSRCDSAHLVKVLDFSTEPDGYVALIMEWLHGESLASFLRRRDAVRGYLSRRDLPFQ